MDMIYRKITKDVQESLFKGKVVIIYGPRQVGKTTLVKSLMSHYPDEYVYLNCDEVDVRVALSNKTSTELKSFIGNMRLVVIDEAQRVENIGLTLKLLVDNFPEIQVLATGSSAFELSNKISEPLTGRKKEFFLFPFSLSELVEVSSLVELKRRLEDFLIFGLYPDVVISGADKISIIRELATSYSYKDVLAYQDIRRPELLEKLLQALALQIGSEVSYTELANLLRVNKVTIENYIRILEQAYIIFRVGPFSRNIRNELKKKRKIYFYDLGLRNALINNFNPLSLRQDVGALWENFLIVERLKRTRNSGIFNNIYFWRTTSGKEIDYLEERDGVLFGYEFKWRKTNFIVPKEFLTTYQGSSVKLINQKNYLDFII